jgi:ribose transport system substrate-binding protein
VLADACAKGIAIINFDSLVDTNDVTAKVNTDSNQWGEQATKFMIDALGGKGKIIILNGPAGVSVSDDRRAGGDALLKANPDIQILAETNTAYNVAPAQEAVTSLLFANPEIDGILSFGGALSAGAVLALDKQGREQVPITGENARQFLELWKEKGLKSWATMQPNWLGAFAAYTAVQALEGKDVPAFVNIYSPYDRELFAKLLAQK